MVAVICYVKVLATSHSLGVADSEKCQIGTGISGFLLEAGMSPVGFQGQESNDNEIIDVVTILDTSAIIHVQLGNLNYDGKRSKSRQMQHPIYLHWNDSVGSASQQLLCVDGRHDSRRQMTKHKLR